MDLTEIQLGPLATWVSAILTVGTLFISLRLFQREQDSRRKEQASKVNAWPVGVDIETNTVMAAYSNTSEEPVYDVTIQLHSLESLNPAIYDFCASAIEHVLPPTSEPVPFKSKLNIPLSKACDNPPFVIPPLVTIISFVDTSGRSWTRNPGGTLTEYRKTIRARVKKILLRRYDISPPRKNSFLARRLTKINFAPWVWVYNYPGKWKYRKHPNADEYERERNESLLKYVAKREDKGSG